MDKPGRREQALVKKFGREAQFAERGSLGEIRKSAMDKAKAAASPITEIADKKPFRPRSRRYGTSDGPVAAWSTGIQAVE